MIPPLQIKDGQNTFAVQPILDDPGGHKLFFLADDHQSLSYHEVVLLFTYLDRWMTAVYLENRNEDRQSQR